MRAISCLVILSILFPGPAWASQSAIDGIVRSAAGDVGNAIAIAPNPGTQLNSELTNAGVINVPSGNASYVAGTISIGDGNSDVEVGEAEKNSVQVSTGVMEILLGLGGISAAGVMVSNANRSMKYANGLTDLPGSGAAGVKNGGSASTASTDSSTSTSTSVNISPGKSAGLEAPMQVGNSPRERPAFNVGENSGTGASSLPPPGIDLQNGAIGKAMDHLERIYGLDREEVLASIRKGIDPKEILANAPLNPPSMDTLKEIEENILAKETESNQLPEGEIKFGWVPDMDAGASRMLMAERVESGSHRSTKSLEQARRLGLKSSEATRKVSPEVEAALLAADAKLGMPGKDIFHRVHRYYEKLQPALCGEKCHPKPRREASIDGKEKAPIFDLGFVSEADLELN